MGVNLNPNGTAGYFENFAAAGAGAGDGLLAITRQSGGFAVWGAHLNTTGGTAVVGYNSATAIYPGGRAGGAFTGNNVGVAGYAATNTGIAGQFTFAPGIAAGTAQGFAIFFPVGSAGRGYYSRRNGYGSGEFFPQRCGERLS
ncbi:MAG: hypothetical protein KatS3mg026_1813 [Bacteroidia bacterium]|nr:MAG: hypothetical protein KatS3mg026_1813 [Bacteroidia bacterium]